LSAPDYSALSAWEEAIDKAVADLRKSEADSALQSSFEATRNSTKGGRRLSVVCLKSDENEEIVVKKEKLEKCGQRMKTWTTRWFILTDKRITYYSDESYSNKKGERVLDIYSSVKQKPSEGNRTHLFALYTGLAEVELLMSAPSSSVASNWVDCITEAIQSVSTAATYMSVKVSVCTAYSKQVAEPIYKICVQTFRGCLEEYYHFADIRDIYNQLLSLAPSLRFENKFPQSYKKSSFGGVLRLTAELLEERRRHLEKWLQEVFDAFPSFGVKFGLPLEDSDDDSESENEDEDEAGSVDDKDEARGSAVAGKVSAVQLWIGMFIYYCNISSFIM
jgi:hypothetical protein